jgi:hypothetical protein
MRANIANYYEYQVFLNYPFDDSAYDISLALHFAVIAAGLLPVCAHDLTVPDQPRIDTLVKALTNCRYSAHDLSRVRGEGEQNFARFNMPLELGMALFYALQTQRVSHQLAFCVPSPYEFRAAISDLGGFDALDYHDPSELVAQTYGWLWKIQAALSTRRSTAEIQDLHAQFRERLLRIRGGRPDGRANHDEAQELMFQICSEAAEEKLWDWRNTVAGRIAFPPTPLSWIEV